MPHRSLAPIAVVLLAVVQFACSTGHPSDQALINAFRAHRADFARLAMMSDSDARVIRIAPGFTRLDTNWAWPRPDSLLGLSVPRWNQYKELFRRLGLDGGLQRDSLPNGSPLIIFMAHGMGIVGHGSSKGYAYSRLPLTPTAYSLDSYQQPLESATAHGIAFRPIEPHWYIEYDW